MKQNREPRNRTTHIWIIEFTYTCQGDFEGNYGRQYFGSHNIWPFMLCLCILFHGKGTLQVELELSIINKEIVLHNLHGPNVNMCVHAQSLSHTWLFVTLWPASCQAHLSMGFSRQEYWSGLPGPPPGVFLTQGSKPCLLHLLHRQVSFLLLGSPEKPSVNTWVLKSEGRSIRQIEETVEETGDIQSLSSVQFSCSVVSDFATPWNAAH